METYSLFYWNVADAISGETGFQSIHYHAQACSAADAVRRLLTEFPDTYTGVEKFLAVAPGVCSIIYADGRVGDDWTPVTVITDNES